MTKTMLQFSGHVITDVDAMLLSLGILGLILGVQALVTARITKNLSWKILAAFELLTGSFLVAAALIRWFS